ncbi:MAG: hypothetical protein ACRYG7_15320 [Janthinobacterium lividum]
MQTLANQLFQAPTPAASPSPTSTHWLWWVFLLGVLGCSFVGPTCALH